MSSLALDPQTGLPRRRRGKSSNQDAFMRGLGVAPPSYGGGVFERAVGRGPGGYGGAGPGYSGPGQINIPGYNPDYRSLIEKDPVYFQFRKDLLAQGVATTAQRNAAMRRALIQSGLGLDLGAAGSELGFDTEGIVDDDTLRLAGENQQSGRARLERQHGQNVRAIRNALAARGLLGSGEEGFQLQENQRGLEEGLYDAQTRLMDLIGGVQTGYAQEQARIARENAGAAGEAATRQAGLPQNQPTAGQQAVYDHVDSQGNPVYKTPDGKLFNPDGTPYTPPAAAPPPVPPAGGAAPPAQILEEILHQTGGLFTKAL